MSFEKVCDPSREDIARRYKYNPDAGGLILLENRGSERVRGVDKRWYKTRSVNGRKHLEHRLVWILLNGAVPPGLVVDHIDRNKHNNRIENLRAVPWRINTRNSTTRKGRTLPRGVYPSKSKTHPFVVRVNGGHYETAEEAAKAAKVLFALAYSLTPYETLCGFDTVFRE